MALKRKLTKVEFDALPDLLKAEYKVHGDGYVLDADDATELQNAFTRSQEAARAEKERADRLQAERDTAEAARIAAETEAAKKKGDIPAIEASWQAKLDAAVATATAATAAVTDKLRKLLVTDKARQIATEISNSPDLILPHIERRLSAELDGDEPKTRVLDADGKPTALTTDDLAKEFVANAKYAAIIIGTKAGGGNAGQQRNGGTAPGGKKISEMSEPERVALHREIGGTEYNRRVAEEKGVAA